MCQPHHSEALLAQSADKQLLTPSLCNGIAEKKNDNENENNLPKISIITTSFNSEDTIEETIRSVIGQDYADTEYIIIDGASTDGTLGIINRYRDKISKVISEHDNGISDAFNKGIRHATGDLICFINSDDVLLPGVLSRVARHYDGRSDIYCGNVLLWNPATNFQCREVPSTDFPLMPFFRHVAHQGMFATKVCYRKYGTYDTKIRYPMDLDFLIRASRGGARFHYMDIDIARFRTGGATGSNSIWKKRHDYIYMVRKNGGNILQAYTFYAFLVCTQLAKQMLGFLGSNRLQRMRYGEVTSL